MAGWQLMVAAALVLAIVGLLILVLVSKKTAQAVWGVGGVLGVLLGVVAGAAVKDSRARPEAVAMAAPAEATAPVGTVERGTRTSGGDTQQDLSATGGETTPAPVAEATGEPAPEPEAVPVPEPEAVPEPGGEATGVPAPEPEAVPVPQPARAAEPAPEPAPAAAPAAEPPAVPSVPTGDSEERANMLWEYREEARAVATDPGRCADAEEVARAWAKVRQITRDDEIFTRGYILTKWLERCRSRIERRRNIQLTYDRVLARREFDKTLQKRLRDSGRSPVWVRVTGATDARLWITGGGFDAASENELLDSGLRAELTELGFLRVIFVHGTERNVHHFEPEREADIVRRELERLGLADPLEL